MIVVNTMEIIEWTLVRLQQTDRQMEERVNGGMDRQTDGQGVTNINPTTTLCRGYNNNAYIIFQKDFEKRPCAYVFN